MTTEPPGTNCAAGGVRLQVGSSDPSYVCDGSNGAAGGHGQSVSVIPEAPGANCAAGGVKLQVGPVAPTYVCNGTAGAQGTAGTDGKSVIVSTEPAGVNCADGGVKLQVGPASPSYVCNGTTGAQGAAGQSVTLTPEPGGANCASGGAKLQVAASTTYVCDGTAGANGAPGAKAVYSIFCQKVQTFRYSGLTSYEVVAYSTGDVWADCHVWTSVGEFSGERFYISTQAGAASGGCVVGADIDAASAGWFNFQVASGVAKVTYNDTSSAYNGATYTYAQSDCVTTFAP